MEEERQEHAGTLRLGSPLRPLLTYGVPYVGAGVWAFSRFPEQLRWTSEIFARVFGLAAPFYEDLTHVEGYGDALDAAIDALEREPDRVLDLCCGTGFAARQIQQAFPDAEVVGVDLSPEMVLMARREADEDGLDIEFEVDDARALQLDDESFDLVVSHNAAPFPEEAMRVLGPSGTALTVWSFGGPWVGLAWPALAKRFRKQDALYADGFRAGPGFYGIVEKSGLRRRRHTRTNGSGPPAPGGRAELQRRADARRAGAPARTSTSSRAPVPVPPRPPAPPPSAGVRVPGRSRSTGPRPGGAGPAGTAKPPALTPRSTRRAPGTDGGRPRAGRTVPAPPSPDSEEAPSPSAAAPSQAKRPAPKPATRRSTAPAGSAGTARRTAKPAARTASGPAAKPAARTPAKPAAKRSTPKAPPKAQKRRPAPPAEPAPSGQETPSAGGSQGIGTSPADSES